MSIDIETASKNAEENIKKFIPSTEEEIKSFDLKTGDKCKIEVIECCNFTGIYDVYETNAYVENEISLQGTKYKLYFSYDDGYGLEAFSKFEDTKILKKYSGIDIEEQEEILEAYTKIKKIINK